MRPLRSWSDVLSADSGPELQHALPLARRTFAAAGMLYCELEVYQPTLDVVDGPSAHLGRLRPGAPRGDGRATGAACADRAPCPTASWRSFIAVPMRGLKPGDYDLVLQIEDAVTGRKQELHEPFSLTRPARPSLAFYRDLVQDYTEGRGDDAVATLNTWRTPRSRRRSRATDRFVRGGAPARAAAMLHTEAAIAQLASRETGGVLVAARDRPRPSSRERRATPPSAGTGCWPWASSCRPGAIARPRP